MLVSRCWCVGITHEAWEWVLVNKYGKVCYTNLLTQAQVPYTNFDFPTFRSVNLRHESKLGCTRIQKLLGFGVCGPSLRLAKSIGHLTCT